MWPWEHLALGYLLYSLGRRATGESPTDTPVLALAVGTQLPDLVDKPLTWTFPVLPGGTFAHTVFVAVPAVALGFAVGWRVGRVRTASGFAVGYLSHLLGDVLYPIALGDLPEPGRFLWPVVATAPPPRPGLVENFLYYLERFHAHLVRPGGWVLFGLELALLGAAAGLWMSDGTPGIPRRAT